MGFDRGESAIRARCVSNGHMDYRRKQTPPQGFAGAILSAFGSGAEFRRLLAVVRLMGCDDLFSHFDRLF